MNYLEIIIDFEQKNPWNEIAVSEFSKLSFNGFDLSENLFRAYVSDEENHKEQIMMLISEMKTKTNFTFQINLIEHKNWNEVWESSFDPISINDDFFILAPFHELPASNEKYVLIEPKMSFGTGHHQTTFMISKFLLDRYSEKNSQKVQMEMSPVLDMGAGTGVLSIIAEKLLLQKIVAVENEYDSYLNLNENISLNSCQEIQSVYGGFADIPPDHYALILANINKTTLISNFEYFQTNTVCNSVLVLSGFLNTDFNEMLDCALRFNFELLFNESKDEWLMMVFKRK